MTNRRYCCLPEGIMRIIYIIQFILLPLCIGGSSFPPNKGIAYIINEQVVRDCIFTCSLLSAYSIYIFSKCDQQLGRYFAYILTRFESCEFHATRLSPVTQRVHTKSRVCLKCLFATNLHHLRQCTSSDPPDPPWRCCSLECCIR